MSLYLEILLISEREEKNEIFPRTVETAFNSGFRFEILAVFPFLDWQITRYTSNLTKETVVYSISIRRKTKQNKTH